MAHESDFLVIGSGIAGLLFALKVADHGTVTIITKRNIAESNTAYAQGGIAAVLAETDTFESHIADTHASGDGLCNPQVVETVVKAAPERIQESPLQPKPGKCPGNLRSASGSLPGGRPFS